jgi:hypothetical protein
MRRVNHHHWLLAAMAAVVVASWAASPVRAAIPPDPDNAALLYYQAFISIADLDKEARDHIGKVATGQAAPNEKTRKYIEECHGAIDFADGARPLQICDWGFRYSQGFDALMPHLAQVRFLAFVLLADARVRALDGDYKGALERCLQMRTFARHVGDDTLIAYLVGVAVQRLGYERMNDIVGQAAKDTDLLRWLQDKLATSANASLSPVTSLKIEMEIAADLMQVSKRDKLAAALKSVENPDMEKFYASADEATLARARQLYSQYLTSALAILSATKPYEQAHIELANLIKTVDANDPSLAIARFITPALGSILSARTLVETCANATKAGVAICLQRAQTGRLPEVLPADLPKDPFSGQDFQYKRTSTGFTLRCRGKDLAKDKTYEYTFPVK